MTRCNCTGACEVPPFTCPRGRRPNTPYPPHQEQPDLGFKPCDWCPGVMLIVLVIFPVLAMILRGRG